MKGAFQGYHFIYIIIKYSQSQVIFTHLLLFASHGEPIFQVLADLAVPVADITIPQTRPDDLIVIEFHSASHCHIDVLRQIGLHLRLIFLKLHL